MPDTATPEAPRISIIMAAYNAAATLRRSVGAVVAQTFACWELLIIDDGSTDSTPAEADRLAAADSRIRVVHQPNSGISAVRRRGVEMARGEYIIHFDADDYAEPDMLERMLEAATASGTDITVAGFYEVFPGGKTINREQYYPGCSTEEFIHLLLTRKLHGALWNKLIRRETYRRAGINFADGLSYGEDIVEVMKMLRAGASYAFINASFYHYIHHSGSATAIAGIEAWTRRKEWLEACARLAGEPNSDILDVKRYQAKFFALANGLISRREFYSYSPTPLRYYPSIKQILRLHHPAMLLATLRLFPLARLWSAGVRSMAQLRRRLQK